MMRDGGVSRVGRGVPPSRKGKNQFERKIQMTRKLIAMLTVAVAAAMPIIADTETVDGITWTYREFFNGQASLGMELEASSGTAVPTSTSGAITIPSTLGGKPVTRIGRWAFFGCSQLTNVTIPESVKWIESYAFGDCSGLKSVTIPDGVVFIWDYTFSGCSGLMSVTIPNSVWNIGNDAFSCCSSLRSVTIPNSVTSIGDSAFGGCYGLTSVTIPDSVTSIGKWAFSDCRGLKSVTIPNSVTSIGDSAFGDCISLTSMTISNCVTFVDNKAFGGCNNLADVMIPQCICATNLAAYFPSWQSITNVVVAGGVGYIADSAFAYCMGLKSVTIPESVTRIGDRAFGDCSNLMEVNFLGDAPDVVGEDIFQATRRSLVINVPQDSIGWSGGIVSSALPDAWGGRRIVHAGSDGSDSGDHGGSSGANPSGGGVQTDVDARYELSNAPKDRAIASVMVDDDCAIDEFVLTDGKVYDCALRIVNTADTAVTLTLPSGYTYEWFKGTKPLTIPANSKNMLTITRTANKTFLVSRQELETAK